MVTVLQDERKLYQRETGILKNEGRASEMVNTWVNTKDYFSPEFFKISTTLVIKGVTLSGEVSNVSRFYTYEKQHKRVKELTWPLIFCLKW